LILLFVLGINFFLKMTSGIDVKINIYRINEGNLLFNIFGIKAYHTSLEFDNIEYAFGKNDIPYETGVYESEPKQDNHGIYVKSIILGKIDRRMFYETFNKLKQKFLGKNYNFLLNNCNHFTFTLSCYLFKKENNNNNLINKSSFEIMNQVNILLGRNWE